MYRGYVKSNEKGAIEKFKDIPDEKLRTLDNVKKFDSYGGILAEDIIMLDVDSIEDSDKLLDILDDLDYPCIARFTEHGVHFYFKNTNKNKRNGTKLLLPIGLVADVKYGYNSTFEPLKINGEEREIALTGDELGELPYWLRPLSKRNSKKIKIDNLRSGDGRNETLYPYILTLQSEGLSKEEIKKTFKLINKYIFEDPLPVEELETITRDEAFNKKVFYVDGKFSPNLFGDYLISELNIKQINGQLHSYDDGVYVAGTKIIESKMLEILPSIRRSNRQEVLSYIDIKSLKNYSSQDANFIAFKNGVYNIKEKRLEPYTPNIIITNKIDYDYEPSAKCSLVDEIMDKLACHQRDLVNLLYEIIAYTFYRRNELGKFFILTGSGANGKSTYLDMIRTLLGSKNISSLDVSELDQRFKTSELAGKLANIGDDISDSYIKDTSILKKLVTGEAVTAERKGLDPFMFENYSKLLFSANSIPRLGKGSDTKALNRRMVIVPFNATFSPKDPDYKPYIKYDLRQENAIKYLIVKSIEALHRILENNGFTKSELADRELEKYEYENNPILGFFDDLEETDYLNQPTKDVYKLYTEYCLRNGLNSVSNISFSRQITSHFNLTSKSSRVNGKVIRIYIKEEE